MFGVQDYYSVANNLREDAIVHNLSRLEHVMLMGKLPLSTEPYKFDLGGMGESIWIWDGMTVSYTDPEYGAKVNGYLVPVNTEIVLHINKSALDRECPEYALFDMFRNIERLHDNVGIIRFLENRRNAWLEDRITKGLSLPQEYDCDTSFFNITDRRFRDQVLFAKPGTREARPNHIVSERLIAHYLGEWAVRDDSFINNPEKYERSWLNYYNNLEEFNMDLVNWINRNIYDLANIGFCGSTFPDVIHFDYSHRPGTFEGDAMHHLPVGVKVYKKIDKRTASERVEDAKEEAKARVSGGVSRFTAHPFIRACVKMLPLLAVMLVLYVLGHNWYDYSGIIELVLYLMHSFLVIGIIYFTSVLVYYAFHRK